jgi:hypothetical protein
MPDTEIEVTVTIQRVTPQQRGWMPGFFEEVIGGWVGEPLSLTSKSGLENNE